MNREQALQVLRKTAAYQPSMHVDALVADVWAEGLEDLNGPDILPDALDAVTNLCRGKRQDGRPWLVELRDIRAEVARIRHQRYETRKHHVDPPSGLDPVEYVAWQIATAHQLQARDWTPPDRPQLTARPVKALTTRIAKETR